MLTIEIMYSHDIIKLNYDEIMKMDLRFGSVNPT